MNAVLLRTGYSNNTRCNGSDSWSGSRGAFTSKSVSESWTWSISESGGWSVSGSWSRGVNWSVSGSRVGI